MSERPDVDSLFGRDLNRYVCLNFCFSWYALQDQPALLVFDGERRNKQWRNLGNSFDPTPDQAVYYDFDSRVPRFDCNIAEAIKLVEGFRSFQITVVGDSVAAKFDFERVVVPLKSGDDLQAVISTAICRAFLKWKWRNQ